MTHIWVRAEQRQNERRVGITPKGVSRMLEAGYRVTVEHSQYRCISDETFAQTGCEMAAENSWPSAPHDAIIFGLKELPEDGTPLVHRHIMFGHAYKGQPDGRILLERFKAGNGTLFDLEYLLNDDNRRVAAFGYWAGYAGAAVTIAAWAAQKDGGMIGPVSAFDNAQSMNEWVKTSIANSGRPTPDAIIIGALGRVGTGARECCSMAGIKTTNWDMAETANGGPFPEILQHDLFFNCILANPGCPVFVEKDATSAERKLTAIGDIACDPSSDYSPIKIYNQVTGWQEPVTRVHDDPIMDVMAIDNLPSLLPLESSMDFADQLLPSLLVLNKLDHGVWGRANAIYNEHIEKL